MRECVDEGILQSYFDRELPSEQLKEVASHLAACESCTVAARELESEIGLLATALSPEFETAVPTERLRQRIDAAISGLQPQTVVVNESSPFSLGAWLQSLVAPFSLTPQRAFGYAGLVLVLGFGLILGLTQWRSAPPQVAVKPAESNETAPVTPIIPATKENAGSINATTPGTVAVVDKPRPQRSNSARPQLASSNNVVASKPATADKVKLLPGERSYLQTIAKLDSTIKETSNRPMRPALQAEYERNLALVDRALAATRNAAKKNPNDPDAAEFMMAAYQNKVNLLNAVAEARTFNRQQD